MLFGNKIKEHKIKFNEQYQIMCSIKAGNGDKITWSRHGRHLETIPPNNLKISKSGKSLYLTPAYLFHSGSYVCELHSHQLPTLSQIHNVIVYKQPVVRVSPSFMLLETEETGRLVCEALGSHPLDPPKISWTKNGITLPQNSSILMLKSAKPEDTGSYACSLTTGLGTTERAASVVVRKDFQQPERSLRNDQFPTESFVALYSGGVRVFNGNNCKLERVVPSSYMSPAMNRPTLCHNYKCFWSDAVRVGSYLYAALKEEKAVAIIGLKTGAVKQVLPLDFNPMRLFYIPWKDQVWIETWHDSSGVGRTVLVVHSASEDIRHGVTHALPLTSSFDTVSNIFLPGYQVFSNPIGYGYVTHNSEMKLHKVDLHKLSMVGSIDLSEYYCQPENVAFLTNVGVAVVYCRTGLPSSGASQLVLDYLSDQVVANYSEVRGVPVVSPDSSILVSVDAQMGRIFVQKLNGTVLTLSQTIDELLPLFDWTIFPSDDGLYGFYLYAISKASDSLIRVALNHGRVDQVAELKSTEFLSLRHNRANAHQKIISTSNYVNANYIGVQFSSSHLSTFSLSNTESVKCEIGDLPHLAVVLWT